MHEQHNEWVPKIVFGELLSGDNYDDSTDRVVGGRNGYGAKLANTTTFCIETIDSKAGKKYAQTWHKNMSVCSKPKILLANEKTYKGYLCTRLLQIWPWLFDTGYDSFQKRVYDIAGTTPPDVRLPKWPEVAGSNFKQYCSLYFEDEQSGVRTNQSKWEVWATVAPDQQAQQVSFCNAICTTKGGEHVKYVLDDIAKHVIPLKAFKDLNVKNSQVRNSTFVFINALISNPSFDSQTKETLTTRSSKFGPAQFKPKISDKFAKAIVKKSGIIEEIQYFARAKSQRALEKKTGAKKKTKIGGIPKLDDANWSGRAAHKSARYSDRRRLGQVSGHCGSLRHWARQIWCVSAEGQAFECSRCFE